MTANRFEGKIILVTGGNSGIGLATATRLVSEGATGIITGRNRETLNRAVRASYIVGAELYIDGGLTQL